MTDGCSRKSFLSQFLSLECQGDSEQDCPGRERQDSEFPADKFLSDRQSDPEALWVQQQRSKPTNPTKPTQEGQTRAGTTPLDHKLAFD